MDQEFPTQGLPRQPKYLVRVPHGMGEGLVVVEAKVSAGDRVKPGDQLLVLRGSNGEEFVSTASRAGVVAEVPARPNTTWSEGELLVVIDPPDSPASSSTSPVAPAPETRMAPRLRAAVAAAAVVLLVAGAVISAGGTDRSGSDDADRKAVTAKAHDSSEAAVAAQRLARCSPARKIATWNSKIRLRQLSSDEPVSVATPSAFTEARLDPLRVEVTACVTRRNRVADEPIRGGSTVSVAWLATGATTGNSSDSLCVQIQFHGARLLSPLHTATGPAPRTDKAPSTRYYNIPRGWPRGKPIGGRYVLSMRTAATIVTSFSRCSPSATYGGRSYGPSLELG